MLAKKAQFLAMLRYFGRAILRQDQSLSQSQQPKETISMTTSLSSIPHFGNFVKKIHAQKGISQRSIAEKIGMDAGNYNRLLNRSSMNASTLWVICKALDVSFGDIE